jgi:hypothetical protein
MTVQGYNYTIAPPPNSQSSAVYFPSSDALDFSPDFNAVTQARYSMAPATSAQQGIRPPVDVTGQMRALRGVTIVPGGNSGPYDWRAYDGASLPNFGYTADDTGGCEAEGRRLVTEPAIEAMEEVDQLAAPLLQLLLESPESVAVGTEWTDCMSDEGHMYLSPLDVGADMLSRAATGVASSYTTAQWNDLQTAEQQLANEFSACSEQSGLDDFIEGTIADEWADFKASNLQLLNRAGGLTGATTGAVNPGGPW